MISARSPGVTVRVTVHGQARAFSGIIPSWPRKILCSSKTWPHRNQQLHRTLRLLLTSSAILIHSCGICTKKISKKRCRKELTQPPSWAAWALPSAGPASQRHAPPKSPLRLRGLLSSAARPEHVLRLLSRWRWRLGRGRQELLHLHVPQLSVDAAGPSSCRSHKHHAGLTCCSEPAAGASAAASATK